MKKLFGLTLVLSLCFFHSTISYGAGYWVKTYGGSHSDFMYSIEETTDGGYVVAGETSSFGAGNKDAWVIKLDSNGNVIWQKTYGGTGDDIAKSIQQTTDGGYVVAGSNLSSTGNLDGFVLKLNSNGQIEDCNIIETNNEIIMDTFLSGQDSSFTTSNTSVIPKDTTITPANSSAEITTLCGYSEPCATTDLLGTDDPKLYILRYFRDNVLSKTNEGKELIKLYYQWSPAIVKAMEGENEGAG